MRRRREKPAQAGFSFIRHLTFRLTTPNLQWSIRRPREVQVNWFRGDDDVWQMARAPQGDFLPAVCAGDSGNAFTGVCVVTENQSTPAAEWREKGEADPHGNQYDCERAALTLGTMTDDELANEAFLNYDRRPSIQDLLDGKGFMPIVWMTAVKERIRWLSRALVKAQAAPPPASTEAAAGAEDPVAYVCEHATHPGDYTRLVSFEQTDHSKDFVCRPLFYGAPARSVAREALAHIVEYWNRDRNEGAMYDALEHIIETAAQALESEADEAATSEQTAVYDTEYVREKFADYQSQIEGLKEELEFVRKASPAGSNPHRMAGYMRASKLAHSIEASKRSVKHVVNDDNSIDVVTLPWGHWALLAANVELLLEWVFEEDQCHCPVKQAAGEQRLEKPAKVGGVRFRAGVKWSAVIEAAQRLHECDVTPENEANRIAMARETLEFIRTGEQRHVVDEDGLIGSAIDGDALIEAVFKRTIPFTYKSFGRALLAEWTATPEVLTAAGGENANLTEEDKRDLEEARKSLQCFSMSTEPVDRILARRAPSKDSK